MLSNPSNLIGFAFGIIGLFAFLVSIIFFLITQISKPLKLIIEKVEILEHTLKNTSDLHTSYLFLAALEKEKKFWSKLLDQREEKTLIAMKIANDYIEKKDIILVDSGTTVDQIPLFLAKKNINVEAFTNNLLAAILVIPFGDSFDCTLIQGEIDPIYGATYNTDGIEEVLKPIAANQIILAATRISFNKGPMVNIKDYRNRKFKRELVRKALDENQRLIIAVDWTKFKGDLENDEKNEFFAVLDTAIWKVVKGENRFILVLTQPPDSSKNKPYAVKAQKEIDAFIANMKRGGMKVYICC